jgi:hypothetical protein
LLTLRKEDREVPKAALLRNPRGSRKRGRNKTNWRTSVTKEAGRSWNELWFLVADRSGKSSETTYVPKGTTDSIIYGDIHYIALHYNVHFVKMFKNGNILTLG